MSKFETRMRVSWNEQDVTEIENVDSVFEIAYCNVTFNVAE